MPINWQQLGLDIDGEAMGDRSGWSVLLSAGLVDVEVSNPYGTGIKNNSFTYI